MSRRRPLLRRLAGDRRGAAGMELVLLTPIMFAVFVGTVEYGNFVYTKMRLRDALNTGANYALVAARQVTAAGGAQVAADVARVVRNAEGEAWADAVVVVNNGPTATNGGGGASAGGTAAPANDHYCPTVSFDANPPYAKTFSYGAPVAPNSMCAGGTTKAGKFVRITASRYYQAVFGGTYRLLDSAVISTTTEVQVS